MKLLFDVSATQPNSSGKRHGGGRYGEIILFRMIERKLKFACFYDSSKWLNPKVKTACQKGKNSFTRCMWIVRETDCQ